jgi:type VI secretion system protein ImpA
MKFDFLREPVSEAEPAGPDLEENLDKEYGQITAEISGLIPERYFTPQMGGGVTPFDRGSIDYDKEDARLIGLLKRTRDMRLVIIEARLRLLAGDLAGYAEALEGARILAETFWEQFHPVPFDGTDYIMRVNTLEALNDNALITPALMFVPVLSGRSTVTQRKYLVATGKLPPLDGEEVVGRDNIERMLRPPQAEEEERVRKRLTESRDAAVRCLDALNAIRQIFIEKAGHTNAPKFVQTYIGANKIEQVTGHEPALKGFIAFLDEYIGVPEAETAPDEEVTTGDEEASPTPVAGSVKTHAAAIAALRAAEDYFARMEPSSPAMILVHQARLLVGRPLVEALEALLPEPSANAMLRFNSGFNFSLDITRMKLVTDDMLASLADGTVASESDNSSGEPFADEPQTDVSAEVPEATADGSDGAAGSAEAGTTAPIVHRPPMMPADTGRIPSYTVANRKEASVLLLAVEGFFKLVEPSSPVTVLLARARNTIGKDFAAILNDLLPPSPPSE